MSSVARSSESCTPRARAWATGIVVDRDRHGVGQGDHLPHPARRRHLRCGEVGPWASPAEPRLPAPAPDAALECRPVVDDRCVLSFGEALEDPRPALVTAQTVVEAGAHDHPWLLVGRHRVKGIDSTAMRGGLATEDLVRDPVADDRPVELALGERPARRAHPPRERLVAQQASAGLRDRGRIVVRGDETRAASLDDRRGLATRRDDERPARRHGVEELDRQRHVGVVARRLGDREDGGAGEGRAQIGVRSRADLDPVVAARRGRAGSR